MARRTAFPRAAQVLACLLSMALLLFLNAGLSGRGAAEPSSIPVQVSAVQTPWDCCDEQPSTPATLQHVHLWMRGAPAEVDQGGCGFTGVVLPYLCTMRAAAADPPDGFGRHPRGRDRRTTGEICAFLQVFRC
ncbi:hypothetical protein ACQPZP_26600 [Spirillospora sp. CA-142024]|uniref:hypothetical protein n=1 Tax=Spirillospora sp. CA-142024 TaxID=3240036 RepID=UPI003D92DAB2